MESKFLSTEFAELTQKAQGALLDHVQSAAEQELAKLDQGSARHLFATLEAHRQEDDDGEHYIFWYLNDQDILNFVFSVAWAAASGGFAGPVAASVGVVWALVQLRAIQEGARQIDGFQAELLSAIFRLQKEGTAPTVERLAQGLNQPAHIVFRGCEKLYDWGVLQEQDGVYKPRDRYRCKLPWKPAATTVDRPPKEKEPSSKAPEHDPDAD